MKINLIFLKHKILHKLSKVANNNINVRCFYQFQL
ncbi:MAG: hypothetical protein UZ08_BCD001000227, partial [Candidatus Parvibacillus calidus]